MAEIFKGHMTFADAYIPNECGDFGFEFSFFHASWPTEAKEPTLTNYLPMAGSREERISCIS